LEFATFIDGGIFWDRDNVSISGSDRILNQEFEKRNLVDAGMGIRLNTSLLEKDIYIRLDFPFYIYDGESSEINFNNWIFSFQRSL
jgi:hypothetical protein